MGLGINKIGLRMLSEEFKASMKKKEDDIKKMRDTNAKCTLVVENWIHKNFDSQGKLAMGGDGWKPTSQAALNLRVTGRGSGSPLTLIDRGWLRNRWKRLYTDSSAVIESGVDYGKIHHDGGWTTLRPDARYHRGKKADLTPKRIKVPPRKIIPTHEQIWPTIQQIYKKFLDMVLK